MLAKCLVQAKEVAAHAARFRQVIRASVVQDQKSLGKITKNEHLTNLLTVSGTNSLSR